MEKLTPTEKDLEIEKLLSTYNDALEEEKRMFERLGSPEKCLCFHYSKDGWSRFLAVDLKIGNFSPILASTDKHKHFEHTLFDSLDSMVYSFCCSESKDGKPIIEGFRFDFGSPDPEWKKSLNLELISREISLPISYKDRIYAFTHLSPEVEAYNPFDNPPSFKRLPISNWPKINPNFHVICADPCSNRILLHFNAYGLCAFCPEDEKPKLTCIDPKFSFWTRRSTIADGVLYQHFFEENNPIYAYDLEKRKRLDVEWTSNCILGSNEQYDSCSGFFHLGNGILCLARCFNDLRVGGSYVFAVYFKVEKHPSGDRIMATPGPSHCCEIKSRSHTVSFFTMNIKADN